MQKSKFYGAFALNRRVDLHAIDATPARWCGDAGSSPLDRASTAASSPRNDLVKNCRVHPMHWLISTQQPAVRLWEVEASGRVHRIHERQFPRVPKRNTHGAVLVARALREVVGACVEINQCVGCTR